LAISLGSAKSVLNKQINQLNGQSMDQHSEFRLSIG